MRPSGRLKTEGCSGVATPLYLCTHAACHLPAALAGLSFLIYKMGITIAHSMDIVIALTIGENWLECLIQCLACSR